MPITQTDRIIGVSTPLGDDALLLQSMTGSEEMSRLFSFQLELLSEQEDIDFNKLIGDKMTVRLESESRTRDFQRFFNGYVSRISQASFIGKVTRFQVTLVPWLWFLTRRSDCRIFQNKRVPDIIKEIFDDAGFSDYEESLTGDYREWEYCVQYAETDFNFVSRLMEQEGIYYYFKHVDGLHTLVMADSYSSHEPITGYEEIAFYPPDENAQRLTDHINGWSRTNQVQPGMFVHTDFDFKAPNKALEVRATAPREHQKANYEVYNYPGEYEEASDGENYAKIRLQEFQSKFETFQGEGNAQGISPGHLFKLTDLPKKDQNKEYLLLSASYRLESNDLSGGSKSSPKSSFFCSFEAIDSKEPYRTSRTTPKPIIQGPQTAIVTGPSGEEIFTDEFGRVKVQFHWDRGGASDENSSCWIRVSQIGAGAGWGAMHIPHVGHEVIVEFLEGDPDRPIITGRVYHGNNKPADELPGEKTKSVNRSFGDNDFVVEDKDGDKHILIKQACGNEIRMHETTPNIEIKQECGNEVLMKASGPDIEIKQACGNEIVMHEADGIQIRDKYGNEVVLDSAAGFIRIASPSHDSFIELGKSLKWGTNSDEELFVGGERKATVALNTHDTYVGTKTELSLAAKLTSVNGIDIKKYYAYENTVNYKGRKKRTKGAVSVDSDTSYEIIGGFEDASKLLLDGVEFKLSFDDTHHITINNNGIKLETPKDVTIEAKDIKLTPTGKVIIPDGKLDAGSIKNF